MELLLGLIAGLVPIALIVLLIVYISKTNSLALRIDFLERQLRHLGQLEDDVAELKGRSTAREQIDRSAVVEKEKAQTAQPPPSVQAVAPPVAFQPQAVQETAISPQPISPSPQLPPSTPSRTREEWEALIGGKLLNRIGALALIIGVGFFLKYAFDNNWITETMRVVIGFVIGAALLIAAAHTHKKGFEVFAQGLVGAGLAVLYLSVYASFSFYHLVPQAVAFLMMSAVTMLAFLQAFKYDSLAVSLLGLLGGFLTPFLLSTGETNEVGLFTYIALLDTGILAVLVMKDRWAILEPLAFGATYFIYLLWYKEYYTSDVIMPTVYFVVVFWMLFSALEVYRNLKFVESFKLLRVGVAVANALFFYVALYSLIEPEYHKIMGLVTLLVGGVYFGTAMFVQRMNARGSDSLVRQLLISIVLLVVATAIEFAGFKTMQWWSFEALVLLYCGVRWKYKFVWMSGSVVFVLALLKMTLIPESLSTTPVVEAGLLLNQRAFTLALLSASMGIGAYILKKDVEIHAHQVSRILDYSWPVIVFVLLTVETAGHFRVLMNASSADVVESVKFRELMSLAALWMLYSLLLVRSGVHWHVVPWQHVGLIVGVISVCMAGIRGIAYGPIRDFTLVANFRMLSMLLVIAGTFTHAYWLRKMVYLGRWNADALSAVGVIIVLLLFDLLTGETRDVFQKAKVLWEEQPANGGSGEPTRLSNLQQLSLSSVWLVYSIILMIVGIWRRQRGIRVSSIVLFGFTILKIFIYDLSFLETLYRIFSFIGLGVILLAVSYLYQRYKDVIFADVKSDWQRANSGHSF